MSYGYDPNHPQMIPRAHAKVRYAIKKGILNREPCEVCGYQPAQGHHEDYGKPLEVIWLCPDHHRQLHRAISYGLNKSPHAEIVQELRDDWLESRSRIALEGVDVKRADGDAWLGRSAAASIPSSATSSPLLAPVALDPNDDGAGRTARQRCASCPTGGQL